MKDEDKTKEQLIDELIELRQRIARREASRQAKPSAIGQNGSSGLEQREWNISEE